MSVHTHAIFFAVASGNVDADMKDYKHWCQYRWHILKSDALLCLCMVKVLGFRV